MSTISKHYRKWQCLVRVKDHPQIIKSFKLREDAKRWGIETELKIRREDAGIAKIILIAKFTRKKVKDLEKQYNKKIN